VIAACECEGAPRDLGLDQGRACGVQLRDALARSPRAERSWLPLHGDDARIARDLKRHFPHLAETLDGLAIGARVPARWLVRRLARDLAQGARGARAAGCASAAGALLALDAAAPFIARRSRPEGGFACLALARPWAVSAFAGVNEAGLALVAAPASGGPGRWHAPGALLAQECLERFAKVESALDWCSGRPSGYGAALVFADARGELAGVALRGGERRVLRPEAARLAWADAASEGSELAKRLCEAAPGDAGALAGVLAAGGPTGSAIALVDPVARRVGVAAGRGAAIDWLALG